MAEIALCRYACPNCGTELEQEGYVIVEVQDEVPLQQLLSGEINTTTCAQCNQSSRLTMPLIYHDRKQEFLIIFVPGLADLHQEDLAQIIRDPYGLLVSAEADRRGIELPEPDEAAFPPGEGEDYRKMPGARFHALTQEQAASLLPGYLLRPTIVDTFDVLRTAAQAAIDGMTGQEVVDDMARLQLINMILASPDPITRRKVLLQSEQYLNQELYEVIDTLSEQMANEGKPELVEKLDEVRRHVEKFKDAQRVREETRKKKQARPQVEVTD